MFFAGNDKGLGHLNVVCTQTYQPLRRLLEDAFVPRKAQELLGEAGARQGPQAGAGAAAEYDGCNLNHAFWVFWLSPWFSPTSAFSA